ncbi:MAG TPA: hypothetical protein VMJ35_08175 [Dongiaceae bacterium]|nr:hypothetical protein [Dongiaceae bacterium]
MSEARSRRFGPERFSTVEPFHDSHAEAQMFEDRELGATRERQAQRMRLLWDQRQMLYRALLAGLLASAIIAILIPNSYEATAQLMPPDPQSSSGLAMLTALAGKSLGGLASLTNDLLGMKTSGALFIGVLRSETSQDRILQKFNLQKVYGKRLAVDARKKLDDNTAINEERKSGIITIRVTDHNAQRAADIANAYVDGLNSLVAELSTSAAHRERVFLEGRLKVAKQELDTATTQLAQFSSKNNTLDIQSEGKAMLDAASNLAGQLIAAESELQGLRQIYTDNNARVRALSARVNALRSQLQRLSGAQEPSPDQHNSIEANSAVLQTSDPSGNRSSTPFPTIHNLPLLGAKYVDYYRRAKIQETVFELLTEQYELAKVQEAKETPSVKVLDVAQLPEKKSFPPRTLIILLGTMLIVAVCAAWILSSRGWGDVDPNDPRKVLVLEMAATIRANAPWAMTNGDGPHSWPQKVWSRLKGMRPSGNGGSAE